MNKARKPLVAILIALIIFISFVGATRYYINQNVNLVHVVAAAEPIPPRTEIHPEKLKVIQVPQGHVPDDAAPNTNIFSEEVYYTGEIGLHPGEIITKQKVFTEDNIAYSHTLTLDPDETILGVSTDLVRSAGASVYPGSRIRALAYIPPYENRQEERTEPSRVEIIFDNLKVVGVVNMEALDTSQQEQRGKIPAVIKLAVTPEQERVLIGYQEGYRVWFTILPENYEPDPEIEDYYYRIEHGIEDALHVYPSEEQEMVDEMVPEDSINQDNDLPARVLP